LKNKLISSQDDYQC
jgi:glucan-binding YG repeat protein